MDAYAARTYARHSSTGALRVHPSVAGASGAKTPMAPSARVRRRASHCRKEISRKTRRRGLRMKFGGARAVVRVTMTKESRD